MKRRRSWPERTIRVATYSAGSKPLEHRLGYRCLHGGWCVTGDALQGTHPLTEAPSVGLLRLSRAV